jgi:hypothetical protein
MDGMFILWIIGFMGDALINKIRKIVVLKMFKVSKLQNY